MLISRSVCRRRCASSVTRRQTRSLQAGSFEFSSTILPACTLTAVPGSSHRVVPSPRPHLDTTL